MPKGGAAAIILAACLLSLGGCSVFMRRVDRSRHPAKRPMCSSSRAAPVVDTIGASAPFLPLLVAAQSEGSGNKNSINEVLAYAALALVGNGILFGSSAIYGYAMARRCRRANEDWGRWTSPGAEENAIETVELSRATLLAYLQNTTKLEIRDHPHLPNSLLMTSSSPSTCVKLDWGTRFAQNETDLARLHVERVECRHAGFTVWLGPVDSLPETAQDTACGPALREAIWEADPKQRKQLVSAMPEACRYGAKAFEWVSQAIGAALTGRCSSARSFSDRVRRVDPRYYQEKLAQRPDMQHCLAGP